MVFWQRNLVKKSLFVDLIAGLPNLNPLSKLSILLKTTQSIAMIIATYVSIHWRFSIKKAVLKNFSKFTGKYLCCSLFLIKLLAILKAS